jgi:hypothetical protein
MFPGTFITRVAESGHEINKELLNTIITIISIFPIAISQYESIIETNGRNTQHGGHKEWMAPKIPEI